MGLFGGDGGLFGGSSGGSSGFGLGDVLGTLGGGLALYGMYDAYTNQPDSGGTQTAKAEPYARDASGQMIWNSFMESLMGTNNYKAAMTPQTPATPTASTYSLGSSSTPILDSLSSRDYGVSRMNLGNSSGLAGTGAMEIGGGGSMPSDAPGVPGGNALSLSSLWSGLKQFGTAAVQENLPAIVRVYQNLRQQQQVAQLQEDLGIFAGLASGSRGGYGEGSRDRSIDAGMGGAGAMGGDREGRDYGGMA